MTRLPAFLLLFILSTTSAVASGSVGGFLKSIDLYRQAPPQSDLPAGWLSANRLRLEAEGPLAGNWQFNIAGENLLLYSDPPRLTPLPGENINRRVDLESDWNRDGHFADQLQIDRLQFSWQDDDNRFSLGRQALGFGRILIFSPLDIIAPFAPDVIDAEVRPGVDALQAAHYFGLGGELAGTVVFGQTARLNSYLATATSNISGVDLLGIGGSLRGRAMLGIGAAGSLGGLGIKAEVAFYRGRDVGQPGGDPDDQFSIGALELWYRFANDLVLVAEYLYNGPGTGDPRDYPGRMLTAPVEENLTYLLGRHYLLLAPSYELHPLLNLQGLLIWNLGDDSFLLRPLIDISLADNLSLQLFWSFFVGDKPRRQPISPLPEIRSEFGSAGGAGGLFLAYHF
ncbi:hypothetical protein [Geothermobacter hydrogeniphilus]|uniref:Uncharacterized protein n=1 Tax=Geothermobacter hydrogeniphilus TaxID=1969733 RepID=A0A1X0YCY3_9BACT|nr:hypothetical protein [Geothermobacter hydrogeniphilus]ORJ62976.1 hypothetical protein B5V00_02690 [Geothermobacter hydrogeniphilus]